MQRRSQVTSHKDSEFTSQLELADQSYGSRGGRLDLLQGQNVIHPILRQVFLNPPTSDLYSFNTMFDWVFGDYCTFHSQAVTAHICCRTSIDADTNDLLWEFLEAE